MPQTAIPTAAGETAGSGRRRTTCSPTWKKAGFAYTPPANPAYGSDGSFPERTKCASKRSCSGSIEPDKGQA